MNNNEICLSGQKCLEPNVPSSSAKYAASPERFGKMYEYGLVSVLLLAYHFVTYDAGFVDRNICKNDSFDLRIVHQGIVKFNVV